MQGMTFDQVVDAIVAHREANPRFNLATERDVVEIELEVFTIRRLAGVRGAREYLSAQSPEAPPPKTLPLHVAAAAAGIVGGVAKTVSSYTTGVQVLLDWLGAGAQPVPAALSEARAKKCIGCPKHRKQHWHEWAAITVAETLKAQLGIKNDSEFKTSVDDKLMTCGACLCWMPLKVHVPLNHILDHVPDEPPSYDVNCWILRENL